jgi:phosphoribosyl 1,2-cyclic phosphate phosphodiesterase
MIITILGCGTSTGVPLNLCKCKVCLSENPKNNRLRSSVIVELACKKNILIDVSPDFRQQALTQKIKSVDSILFTHKHADHILGLDDLRPYYFMQKNTINTYGNEETLAEIKRFFNYMFNRDPLYSGGSFPDLNLIELEEYQSLEVFDATVQTIPIMHAKLPIFGYRINNFAYLTDCSSITERSMDLLKDLDLLVLDGLRHKPHPSHLTVKEAAEVAIELNAKRTYLTHMSHDLDYDETNSLLPEGIELAYDGLKIEI